MPIINTPPKKSRSKGRTLLLCKGLDALYLLWLLFSLLPKIDLARFSVWGSGQQTAFPALGPFLGTLCMLCSFWALLRFAKCQPKNAQPFLKPKLWSLCLPAHALYFLLQRPKDKTPQKVFQASPRLRTLQICLALVLQLALLSQLARGYWSDYGQAVQADNAQNYLPKLLSHIDIWFLSIKGISGGLAILESSAVEVGAVVYGSVSIGKALLPIRNLLERISDILFYGRVLLTAIQIIQDLGRYYAPVLLWALLALLLCSYLSDSIFPVHLWLKKCLLLLRAHILLFLFLSLFFQPSLALLDNLVQKLMLRQQYTEFLETENILADLEQQYGGEDLAANGRWSALIDSVQRWVGDLRAKFSQLGRKLFYFALTAVLRTLVLPLLALWALYLLYRSLLGNLLESPRRGASILQYKAANK